MNISSLFPQLAYAIGVAKPLSVFVSSYGTGVKNDKELLKIVNANFDLRPGVIVKYVLIIFKYLFITFKNDNSAIVKIFAFWIILKCLSI